MVARGGSSGVFVAPAVYLFGKTHYAFLAVGDGKGGKFYRSQQFLPHLRGVVVGAVLVDESRYSLVYLHITHGQVVKVESLVVFAFLFHIVFDVFFKVFNGWE